MVNGGPDSPPLDRRISGPRVPGDQQHHTLARSDRPFKRAVDRTPCPVEVQAVQIKHPVGIDGSRAKTLVPAGIERSLSGLNRSGARPFHWGGCRPRWWRRSWRRGCRRFSLRQRLAGKRADRCCDALPQLALLSAERSHARPCPSGAAKAPAPWPTCRRRSSAHRTRRPRRCRRGWLP